MQARLFLDRKGEGEGESSVEEWKRKKKRKRQTDSDEGSIDKVGYGTVINNGAETPSLELECQMNKRTIFVEINQKTRKKVRT